MHTEDERSEYGQTLFIGNGVNRLYARESWDGMLRGLAEGKVNYDDLHSPMPLRAVLLTEDKVDQFVRDKQKELYGSIYSEDQMLFLRQWLALGFDDVLTTNYSYELEMAALGQAELSRYKIERITRSTAKRADTKYLLHNYCHVNDGEIDANIWHVHGEARKPDSMVLGHYYYGNLTNRIIEYCRKGRNDYWQQLATGERKVHSWIDAFIMHDIYIVGCRFDLAEMDLWWLLNRKCREQTKHGKVFFFDAVADDSVYDERLELLKIMIGNDKDAEGDVGGVYTYPVRNGDYKEFYSKAFDDVAQLKRRRTHQKQ